MYGTDICNEICSGCAACMSVCPKSAIAMQEDKKGFRYPIVDENKCVDCGLCKKTCNFGIKKNEISKAYIVKNKNSVQHEISQSGGAFAALSNSILENRGKVFGVVYDENFEAVYGSAKTIAEREAMHGAKYMPARVNYTYKEVEQALSEGEVLFSGTPCQVDALKKYLAVRNACMDNLYTVGIVCHGVPTVLMWREFVELARKKLGHLEKVVCREKTQTGDGYTSTFYGTEKYTTKAFLKIYGSCLCLRDSCYKCAYSNLSRCEDLTLGDAWGVKKHNSDFADPRGVSLVLINSAKGEKLFSAS